MLLLFLEDTMKNYHYSISAIISYNSSCTFLLILCCKWIISYDNILFFFIPSKTHLSTKEDSSLLVLHVHIIPIHENKRTFRKFLLFPIGIPVFHIFCNDEFVAFRAWRQKQFAPLLWLLPFPREKYITKSLETITFFIPSISCRLTMILLIWIC